MSQAKYESISPVRTKLHGHGKTHELDSVVWTWLRPNTATSETTLSQNTHETSPSQTPMTQYRVKNTHEAGQNAHG